jgi:endosialidase-like protein
MPWELDGNSNINGNNNFLGTRNNAPLVFRTNTSGAPSNLEEVMRLTPSSQTARGRVGIGTSNPTQQLTVGSGNVQLPAAQAGTDGNLYLGGRTDAGETGLRLFGGLVNGSIPGGFIDVRSTSAQEGLRIRVDTANGGTERLRVTSTEVRSTVPFAGPGSPSDLRAKVNVRPLSGMLDRLASIRGVAFDWADTPAVSDSMSGQPGIGVIAQEVEAAFPELVHEYGELGYKAVDYNGLIAALLGAAQELRDEVESLRSRIRVLEAASST